MFGCGPVVMQVSSKFMLPIACYVVLMGEEKSVFGTRCGKSP